jgi:hypothetical protein
MTPVYLFRLRQLVLGVMTAALTAACVSIPSDSSVRQGQPVGVQHEPELISNAPPGPIPGATRAEVVSGFFTAMLAYPQTASTARQFLSPDAAASWNPSAGLVVYDDQEIVERPRGVEVKTHTLGSLNPRGSWSSAKPSASTVKMLMNLARVRGEWRIVNPMVGTFVDSDYFDLYFRSFSLYYFDPTFSVLTPDPVYLMLGDTAATSLVSDLLVGPSEDLAGVAATAVPPETEVDVAVSITASGRVEVPLSPTILELSPEALQLFAAQLTWTLGQLPEIEGITITVDGRRVDVPGVSVNGVFGVDEFAGYDPSFATRLALFALGPGGLAAVSKDAANLLPGPIAASAKRPQSAAVDPSASMAAVVDRDGRVLVGGTAASGEPPTTWFEGGNDMLRPSWDVHEVLWLIDRKPRGATVYAVTAAGSHRVAAPGISGRYVRAFAVSRDGVRLAAVVSSGASSRLVMSVIDRDAAHPSAVSLSPARPVITPRFTASDLTGLAWASPIAVMVLASERGGDRQPFEVNIDGSGASAVSGFLPIEPVSVAAGPNVDAPVVIGGANGEIYVQTPELQWARFGGSTPLRAPVYPG